MMRPEFHVGQQLKTVTIWTVRMVIQQCDPPNEQFRPPNTSATFTITPTNKRDMTPYKNNTMLSNSLDYQILLGTTILFSWSRKRILRGKRIQNNQKKKRETRIQSQREHLFHVAEFLGIL